MCDSADQSEEKCSEVNSIHHETREMWVTEFAKV